MSAPTDQFTEQFNEIAVRAQESVTTAVRSWADVVQTVADSLTGEQSNLPGADIVVDRYFDFAQQILDSQRNFAHTVLSAGTQAAQTVTEQTAAAAKQVTAQTVSAVDNAAEKATDTARDASETTRNVGEANRDAGEKTVRAAKGANRS